MKIKDYVMLMAASLFLGWLFASFHNPIAPQPVLQDTLPKVDTPTTINVNGKTALFIGDSHTANHGFGWQLQVCQAVGFKMINASVGGKTTYWMINEGVYRINDKIDYCFVYGGANDMYSSISPQAAVENIKGIARICNGHGVKCIVITGFDPVKCTRTKNPNYARKYAMLQQLLLTQDIEGATVVDTRVVERLDCWDDLCHMNKTGHTKIARKVIKDLALQRI